MAAEHDLPEQNAVEMREEIDCTRTALADKLEALEDRVMDTVHSAQDTVADSIQIAKDTVATVKRTFDIKHHVEQYPWLMVGGCFLGGLALGTLFHSVRKRSRQTPERLAARETAWSGSPPVPAEHRGNGSVAAAAPPSRFREAPPSRPGFFDRFEDEINQVKGMAIGYVMGLARDAIRDSVPDLADQIDGVMNSITAKLGGERVDKVTR